MSTLCSVRWCGTGRTGKVDWKGGGGGRIGIEEKFSQTHLLSIQPTLLSRHLQIRAGEGGKGGRGRQEGRQEGRMKAKSIINCKKVADSHLRFTSPKNV
jgi:hypothetical protein